MLFKFIFIGVITLSLSACRPASSGNQVVDDLIELSEVQKEVEDDIPNIEGTAVGDFIEIEVSKEEKDFSYLDTIEVDEDVSVLPTTLAFAQISRMMFEVELYENRTIKVKGIYYHESMPELDIDRKTVMLLDETSCCQGYLQIELPDGVTYPENGEEIMVVGVYRIASNGEYSYPVLEVTDYVL